MYCPGCGSQNLDDGKFCRVCGTNLANVALALSGETPRVSKRDARTSTSPEKYRRHGMNKLIEGTGLIAGSTLVLAALAIFSNKPDWIIIWVVFGAWLAVLGFLSIAKGISSLIEWKYTSKELAKAEGGRLEMPAVAELNDVAAPITSPKLTPITSVTEHTTKLLDEAKVQNE
jgi:hypothetical protein